MQVREGNRSTAILGEAFVAFFAYPFWVLAVSVALARRSAPRTRSDHVPVVSTHRV
jgi:hypothetical protein